jgi:filamentous hemagglutinin family protein
MKTRHAMRRFTYGKGYALVMRTVLAALLIVGLISVAHAAPQGGVVRAGNAQIIEQGSTTRIQQSSQRAIIDWRRFGINSNELVQFAQPSVRSATLNRVTGDQVSYILGRLDANGQVLLINPNGIIFGNGARINVGSFIASTANISNDNFLKGNLVFDQPGRPGAGIINAGTITAAEGGLIALVAPHVRNDGLIQARLGKVVLGAADMFTIDLYGDGLVNLALSEASLAKLKDAQGQPLKDLLSQTGTIDVSGGQAVLVTAEAAKGVLDSLINMSGTILADSAVQEGGRILLLARGGNVDVSGNMSARGTTGGQIDVLGDQVHLFSTAKLDVNGVYGGGVLHVGGDYQGSGDTYRAQSTYIDNGAMLHASAQTRGNGGEVVVWSDGETSYEGSILARGGAETGNGGLVEVSSKQLLLFNGLVDAGASHGNNGSLLLDPYNFTIGMTEAGLINRVLRTGTSTSVSADNNLYVNYFIDGRGRYIGGGLTLSAGNDVNINDHIVTNNGAINLFAGAGTVNLASDKVVYAGTAPLTVRSGGTLTNAPYLTGGLLSLISTQESVNIDQGIDSSIGDLLIQAAEDVNVNQAIVSLNDGNTVSISAGNDITLNAQINGSGGTPGGTVTLAANRDVNVNDHIVTNNGAISITGGGTVLQKADGTDSYGAPLTKQVRTGNGAISVTSGSDLSLGSLVSTGALNVTSTGGNININVPIYETTGNTTVTAAGNININQVAANTTSGSDLIMTSTGGNINVNAKVGPWDRTTGETLNRDAVPGGSITLSANGDINVNTDILSYKDALTDANAAEIMLNAGTGQVDGTVNLQGGIKVMSDSGAIHVTAFSDLTNGPYINDQGIDVVNGTPTTGYFTTGALNLTSTAGSLTINQTIPDTTGEVTLQAGNAINVNQRIYSNNADISLFAGPGGIIMTTQVDPIPDPYNNGTGVLSDTDSRGSNLTLVAQGDILPSTLRAQGTLTVKSTNGVIYGGNVQPSRTGGSMYPALIELAGSLGISDFYTGHSNNIKAISERGSVEGLVVYQPTLLEVIAHDDVKMTGTLGAAELYAGRDIENVFGIAWASNITEKAGRNITVGSFTNPTSMGNADFSYIVSSLNLSAGTNPFTTFNDEYQIAGVPVKPLKDSWTDQGLGDISISARTWIEGEGGLTAASTGTVAMLKDVHVSYSLMPAENTTDPKQAQQPLTLTSGGTIDLPERIEAMGPVTLISANGNVSIGQTIGAHVSVETPASHIWNPNDLGIASLVIKANNGNISMEEARAEGNITIQAYGNGVTTGFITEFGPGIESVSGTSLVQGYDGGSFKTYIADTDYNTTISTAIVDRLPFPEISVPVFAPGPMLSGPASPALPGALPPGVPGIPGVAGMDIPASSDVVGPEQEIDPERATGSASLSEIIPEEAEEDKEENKKILKFSGGRGVSQEADLGRR